MCIPVDKQIVLIVLVVYLLNPKLDQNKMPSSIIMAIVVVSVLGHLMKSNNMQIDNFADVYADDQMVYDEENQDMLEQQDWKRVASDMGTVPNRIRQNNDLESAPYAESTEELHDIVGFNSDDVNGVLIDSIGDLVPLTNVGPTMVDQGLSIIPDKDTDLYNQIQSNLNTDYYDADPNDGIPLSAYTRTEQPDANSFTPNDRSAQAATGAFPSGVNTMAGHPGYFLLNNNKFSDTGVHDETIEQMILNSKYHDIYHQHANVPVDGRIPLIGKDRGSVRMDPL
jgi:hypothetical protein